MNTYGVITFVIVYTQLATSKPTKSDLVNGKCRQKLDTKPPKNWRNDENYNFKWEEVGFVYNIPEDSLCVRPSLPENGRFICSNDDSKKVITTRRIMCMLECMKGYSREDQSEEVPEEEKGHVYFCQDNGKWLNLHKKEIPVPKLCCRKKDRGV